MNELVDERSKIGLNIQVMRSKVERYSEVFRRIEHAASEV